jgi:hypothetical protein
VKWITRERPKIDRIACPWLVTRFIDREPEFLFVPASRVMEVAKETGATPYDVPDVELSHVGELCSFDAFLTRYGPGHADILQHPVIELAQMPALPAPLVPLPQQCEKAARP